MTPDSVREARAALGWSLRRDGRHDEAVRQIHHALDESGEVPPDWELHRELARIATDREDGAAALLSFLMAVRSAPGEAASAPARDAIELLHQAGSPALAAIVPAQDMSELWDRQGDAPNEVLQLATRLAYLRGEITSSRNPTGITTTGDDDSLAAGLVAEAYKALEEGAAEEALGVLLNATVAIDGPIRCATALAYYALGRMHDAEITLAGASESFDTAVVGALIALRNSSAAGFGNRQDPALRAADAASLAARLDPGHGDSLLLRAEVVLETGTDLDEGRHLLRSALRKFDQREAPLWWRVQERVRSDEEFLYFLMELAAFRNDHQQVLEFDARVEGTTTEYRTDAAIHELAARALRGQGQGEAAAARFREAASQFDVSGDLDRALEMTEEARKLSPQFSDALSIAEIRWRRSYDGDEQAARKEIEAGVEALGAAPPEADDDTVVEACYLQGLLLARASDFRREVRGMRRALQRLLLAALSSPGDSYRSMHLARNLDRAGMNRTAHHFAEHALRLNASDAFIIEGVISVRFNWSGVLDDETTQLLDQMSDEFESWRNTFHMLSLSLSADSSGLEHWVELQPYDAPWAHLAYGMAAARLGAMDRAGELLRPLVGDWQRAGTAEEAVDAAMSLGDPDEAERALDVAAPSMEGWKVRYSRAVIDVARGHALSDELVALMSSARPLDRRGLAYLDGPVFAQANPKGRGEFLAAAAAAAVMLETVPVETALAADLWEVVDDDDRAIEVLVQIAALLQHHDVHGAERTARLFVSDDLGREFDVLARSLPAWLEQKTSNGVAPI